MGLCDYGNYAFLKFPATNSLQASSKILPCGFTQCSQIEDPQNSQRRIAIFAKTFRSLRENPTETAHTMFFFDQAANREVLPPPTDTICTLCCLFAVGVVRMTGYIFNSGRRIRPIAARHVALRRRSCPPSRRAKSVVLS